jgi:tetratricopeptide (TPR) repeat protein
VIARARLDRHPARRWRVVVCLLTAALAFPAPARAHVPLDRQIVDLNARIAGRPAEASLYLKRGEIHRSRSDWNAAAADYRRARELDPALDVVDFCRGRMLLEADRPAEALPILDGFLLKHPDHAGALAARARVRARLGLSLPASEDLSRAIAQYRPTLNADPDLYLERARALAEGGEPRLEEALRGLDQGLGALGPLVALGLYASELEVRLKRFDAALARIDRLAAFSPRKESYLVRRGAILEAAGRTAEARQAYALALQAIASLPDGRRGARAVDDLAARARAGLARLGPSCPVRSAPAPTAQTPGASR